MSRAAGIAGIVLAAGGSQRFGANKLLHPLTLHGMTLPLAAHSLLPWLETFEHTTVVVRPGMEDMCDAVMTVLGATRSVEFDWLVCDHAVLGMASSLAHGVCANRDADGWMIGLADMPAVPAAALAGVRDALRDGADLAAATCAGRIGHPVGFGRRYGDELLMLQGDSGARRLLQRDSHKLVPIEIADHGIYTDIDTPQDLCRL